MNKIAKYLYEKRYNKKVAVRYKEKKETYPRVPYLGHGRIVIWACL